MEDKQDSPEMKFMEGIKKQLSRGLPDLGLIFRERYGLILIDHNSSTVIINVADARVTISGTLAENAYGIATRLDIHFLYYNKFTMITNLTFSRKKFLKDRIVAFLSILFLFPDMNISHFFQDKIGLCYLRRTHYTAKVYIGQDTGLIFLKEKDSLRLHHIEIKSEDKLNRILDLDTSENAIKNICDDHMLLTVGKKRPMPKVVL